MSEHPALDRASFLLGYLIARTDGVAEILELVSEGEALLEGSAEIEDGLLEIEPPEPPAKLPAPVKEKAAAPPATAMKGDLSPNQAAMLEALRRIHSQGGHSFSVATLALEAAMPKGSVTAALEGLEKKGMITRRRTPRGNTYEITQDVTAELMGDPAAGRSAADARGEE